jgi:hypothetical protein
MMYRGGRFFASPTALADDVFFMAVLHSTRLTHKVCRLTNEASGVRKAQH